MPVPNHHADALKSRFAGYYPRDGAVWLGVNLEGMKYDDWPVARLIEREISRPLLLTRYRRKVARPDIVTVLWARDAWQYSARRRIKEANIAPTRGFGAVDPEEAEEKAFRLTAEGGVWS